MATPTTTAEVSAAYADAVSDIRDDIAFQRLLGLYAEDARFEDRAIGRVALGTKAISEYWDYFFHSGWMTDRATAQLVGDDVAVIEEEASGDGGSVHAAAVLRVRGGKIVADFEYYNDMEPGGRRYPLEALKSSPAASDTEAASRATAHAYMAALRALAPARLAPLYARDAVYQDSGRDVRYVGPSAAVAAHAKMFALKGVRFRPVGVVAGPGWAAVMWMRTDREGGEPLVYIPAEFTKAALRPTIHGLSILEIREGKIARETIYSDHLRTVF